MCLVKRKKYEIYFVCVTSALGQYDEEMAWKAMIVIITAGAIILLGYPFQSVR